VEESAMSRAYAAAAGTVEVRVSEQDPEQFIWRDRLYRVHRVLQRWDSSWMWWEDLAAPPTGADRRTWRVEACAGRCAVPGVYDLGFDPGSGHWSILRVFD
jgi:hypothetical protein